LLKNINLNPCISLTSSAFEERDQIFKYIGILTKNIYFLKKLPFCM
jgi:hypothetical protein